MLLAIGLALVLRFGWDSAPAEAAVMGARLVQASTNCEDDDLSASAPVREGKDVERYFRPSKLPVLNDRFNGNFFEPYFDKKVEEIKLPSSLMDTPENTILNYFSILREAENLCETTGGCGTIGNAKIPYPVAYHFLSDAYRNRLSYKAYIQSFQEIAHINLIKLRQVPAYPERPGEERYFIELETIEGSSKSNTYFAYYYGYVYIQQNGDRYEISDVELQGEDFLCAAYHHWNHMAEAVVDIEYGNWCKLVEKRKPTRQDGYIKQIDFSGKDGREYRFIFFVLTNDTDVLTAQYRKGQGGKWELIHMDPRQCLDDDHRKSRNS